MRLGIVDPADNIYSYSVARQTVSIPADTVTVTLGFWAYPISGDPAVIPTPAPRSLHTVQMMGFLPYDVQYVLILDKYSNWIDTLLWECTDAQEWLYHQFDLSGYVGRTIKIQFGAYNTGYSGVTSMYVDDVSLQMCEAGEAGPTSTPTATETPSVTMTQTPTPTVTQTATPVSDLMLPLIHKDSEYPPSTPSPTPEVPPTPTTGPYPYPTYGVWRSM